MELYDAIFYRKSTRKYSNKKVKEGLLEEVKNACSQITYLNKELDKKAHVVDRGHLVHFLKRKKCKVKAPHYIIVTSNKGNDYLQNIGYLGEQLDLYLVSKNIGTLWFGIGKTEELSWDGLDFVIMIAMSRVDDEKKFRKDMFRSKRKPIDEIWTGRPIPGVTEIVRFAPSACNSQPWIAENTDVGINIYRYRKQGRSGIMPADKVSFYNRIDMGIFLCFLDLCLQHCGMEYTVERYKDDDTEAKKTKVAAYKLQ